MKNLFSSFLGIFLYEYRKSEIIARDSRRTKHLFIVKKGSLDIWKRLEPLDNHRGSNRNDSDRKEDEKGL